jgi:hypothetical protein
VCSEYELSIDHFLLRQGATSFQLETAISGTGVAFLTGQRSRLIRPTTGT